MHEFVRRLVALVRRQAIDADVEEELRFHFEMKARETGDAVAAARAVGSTLRWRERARDAWGWQWLDDAAADVRYARRTFRRHPGFTATIVLSLAAGLGANTAVSSIVNGALFKGFPGLADARRFVYISNGYGCCASYADFLDWRARAKSFDGTAAAQRIPVAVRSESGFTLDEEATEITANAFALVGARPFLGRDFTQADEIPGRAPVVMLSYRFWAGHYHRDPGIVGRRIRVDGVPTAVIGVMPEGFTFPERCDLWLPLVPAATANRGARGLWFVVGRLAPGATPASARAEMDAIGRRSAAVDPATRRRPPTVQTFDQFFIGRTAAVIYPAIWRAAGFVLLIACATAATLLLARSTSRSPEIAMRIAVGAGRSRIVRQLVLESVLLAAGGGVLGWVLAGFAVHAYAAAKSTQIPWQVVDYVPDRHVLAYVIVATLGGGVLFGLSPALQLSRVDVTEALKDGGQAVSRRGSRVTTLLIGLEVALATVVVAAAGVELHNFWNVYRASTAFDARDVVTTYVMLPSLREIAAKGWGLPSGLGKYAAPEARASLLRRARAQMARVPGIDEVAFADGFPPDGGLPHAFEIAGAPRSGGQGPPVVLTVTVSRDYFGFFSVPLLAGRYFADADRASAAPVAIVSRSFARAHWAGGNGIGKTLRLMDGNVAGPWRTVVGVVPDLARNAYLDAGMPIVYVPYAQDPPANMWLLARTRLAPDVLAVPFRVLMRQLDPDVATFGPFTLAGGIDLYLRYSTGLLALIYVVFAGIVLLVGTAGVYALIAYTVGQRRHELGVRLAMGATARDIVALLSAGIAAPSAVGVIVGLAAAAAVNRPLGAELIRVSPGDPWALGLAAGAVIASAAIGAFVPARRALGIDPATALKRA